MKLMRWEPFGRDFASLADRLSHALDLHPWDEPERESLGTWYPAVDVIETQDELLLKAELPGMKKQDIDLRIENNVLTLQGERKREREFKDNGYYRAERAYGRFCRSFSLPSTVDPNKIDASYKDGILEVRLPKIEEAKPKQIEVKLA